MKRFLCWSLVANLCLATAAGQAAIGTFAGTDFLIPVGPLTATSAPLGSVQDVTVDAAGNIYVSDRDNHVVVRITLDGQLTVFAGNGLGGYSGDGGRAVNASLSAPFGLAFDTVGNLYIADAAGHRVRRVTPGGVISTYAGTGVAGFNGDGPALQSRLNEPRGLAVDGAGNLYIADASNHRVRVVMPSGEMRTVAGTGTAGDNGDDGPAALAQLNTPTDLAFDSSGSLYVATVSRIRRIGPDQTISSVKSAGFEIPSGLAVDGNDNLYVSESRGDYVYRIAPDGTLTAVAGSSRSGSGFAGDGGPATDALLNNPGGLTVTSAGDILIADRDNFRLRTVSGGTISTTAGNGEYRFSGDGEPAAGATLNRPVGLATDRAGNVFVADSRNNRVRRITTDGIIGTVAGNGLAEFSGDGGLATDASLSTPQDVAARDTGFLIADLGNNRIRSVDLAGIIRTAAGGGPSGLPSIGDGGPATQAVLRLPASVALDAAGNIYIADSNNDRIRKVTPGGTITTVAGGGNSTADNIPATQALLTAPQGVAVDAQNRIYISDTDAGLIRIVENGTIRTIAGGGNLTGDNVSALSAYLDSPRGLALDAAGNLYFAEFYTNRVRRLAGGMIATVAGVAGPGGFAGDGGPAANALLSGPVDVAFDAAGNLYIADSNNGRIRKVFASPPLVDVSPATLRFRAVGGGLLTAPRLLSVASREISGLPFSTQILNGSTWLRLFPDAGPIPATLEVSVDPADLSPGDYVETLRVNTPNANPPFTDVRVELTVDLEATPIPAVAPAMLSFAFVAGSAPKTQNVTVSNLGGQTVPFIASADNDGPVKWLSVDPSSGSATPASPGTIVVTADPAELSEGVYTGTVTVNALAVTASIPVTMSISAVEQRIRLSQSGLTFTGVARGGAVPPQTFRVINSGMGVMPWSVRIEAEPDAPVFLSASPASGSSDASSLDVPAVQVVADVDSLPAGEYFNRIRVESPTALNSPQFIPVVFEVLRPDQDPGPAIQPTELVFVAVAGESPPGSQDLKIYNLKGGPLNYRSQTTTANGLNWIQYLPTEAAVEPDQALRVVTQPDPTFLSAGIHTGVMAFRFDDGSNRKINVLTVVLPAAEKPAADPLRSAQETCAPKDLILTLTVLNQGFVVPAGHPQGLAVSAIDDCGLPLPQDAQVSVSFSNGDPPKTLDRDSERDWSTSWTPEHPSDRVTITIRAKSPGLGLEKSIQRAGSTRSSQDNPRISPGGVVNAANFAGGQPLAPGSMIAIFGTDLAGTASLAPELPLTTELGGTSVNVAGTDLPLIYVSPGQVNAILPYGLNINTEHPMYVNSGGRLSEVARIVMAAAQPAVFETSSGPAVSDEQGILGPGNPARPGETIVVFATGLGNVRDPVVPGAAPGVNPLARTLTAQIDGANAEVIYAGLQPQYPGLYQVNVTIPAEVPPGDHALTLTTQGNTSRPVTIPIGP